MSKILTIYLFLAFVRALQGSPLEIPIEVELDRQDSTREACPLALGPTKPGLMEKLICPGRMLTDEEVSEDLDPIFYIMKQGIKYALKLDSSKEQILEAGFGPDKFTTILVHGWAQNSSDPWLRKSYELMEINAKSITDNLIVMEYGKASLTSYKEAVSRMRAMAVRLARFVQRLIDELDHPAEMIHLVGHSLGSHLAASAAKRISPKIGRLSSLDSAGPCFKRMPPEDADERLSKDCAREVVVYHYDDVQYGLAGQHGTLDIYINGGRSQPGCAVDFKKVIELMSSMVTGKKVTTSHTICTTLACVNMAATHCQQVAYECEDYETFMKGGCGHCDNQNSQCFLMSFTLQHGRLPALDRRGLFERPGSKRLYVATSASGAFCQLHYQILVKFEPHPDLAELTKKQGWQLYVTLVTEGGDILRLRMENQMEPHIFSHLLLYDGLSELTKLTSARLEMRNGKGELPDSLRAASIEINFMSNIDPEIRQSLSTRLCPTHKEANFKQSALGDNLIVFLDCPLLPKD